MDINFIEILTFVGEFLYEHLGEIFLGAEFLLLNLLSRVGSKKVDPATKKALTLAKKEKAAEKAVKKAQIAVSQVEQLKEE